MDKNSSAEAIRPVVCYVTDRRAIGATGSIHCVLERVRAATDAGVDWVQIREKDLAALELSHLALGAVRIMEPSTARARVIVNDRLDVAVAAGAAGVHLGRESLPASDVVRWCREGNAPSGFLIGVSCHSVEEARQAENAEASYVFFGPVFDTPSKKPFGSPQGLARLSEACRSVRIPVIAIGGVDETNGAECLRAGAAGIAAIRLFQESRNVVALAEAVARVKHFAAR
ncbi:MAG TPA: thiamine phosphate synthase [Candidatus Acidoferrales bacterium]|nr:thiamine phosphate synthase [Candidatus Acidoferrales bacterium]